MKKDFESRFMSGCKFSIMGKNRDLFESLNIPISCNYIRISFDGKIIAFCDYQGKYDTWEEKEVSIYEAIPELVPDGMRYNKELDKLVPDIIEHCFNDNSNVWNNMIDNYNIISKSLEKKEIINERENGFIKADLEKLDFSLVDPFAYSDLAFQLTVGAKKYSKDNWKKGDINIYLSALERHIQDIKKALDEDDIEKLIDDTGIQHGGSLLCNSMFIHYFIRQILKDKNVK